VTGTEVPLVKRSTLKTAGGRPQAAVDPRREIMVIIAFFALFFTVVFNMAVDPRRNEYA
jgi:hypothetical protein